MVEVALDDLRDLSRRARRAHNRGTLVVVLGMLALPALLMANALAPTWTGWAAGLLLLLVGAAFVMYAHAVGQSRGAFRRVFRTLNEEKRARRLVVEEGAREKKGAAESATPPATR